MVLQSLRFKITAGVTLVMVVIISLYTYLDYDSRRAAMMRDSGRDLTNTTQIIKGSLQHAMLQQDFVDLQSILDNVGSQQGIVTLMLLNPQNVVRFSPEQKDVNAVIDIRDPNCIVCHKPGLPADTQNIVYVTSQGDRVLRNCNPIMNQPACYQCHDQKTRINGVLITDYSLADVDGQLAEDLRASILLGVGAIVLVILTINLLMHRLVLSRLDRVVQGLRRFGQGDLSQRLTLRVGDELGHLAETFNQMAASLQERNQENTRLYAELQQKESAHTQLLHQVINAQEEERKRVARDLHDQLGATLSGLTMSVEAAEQSLTDSNDPMKERWRRTKTLASQALDETHKLILDLRPVALDELGLVSAIRADAEERLQPRGIQVQVSVKGERRRLAPELELTLFRIAQEAINNIAKYANARHVNIDFGFQDAIVSVAIADDGRGFDQQAVSNSEDKTRGLGLLGMAERAHLAGGSFQIESQIDRGTRVTITIKAPREKT